MLNKRGILSEKHQELLLFLEKTLVKYEPSASKTFELAMQKASDDMQDDLAEIEETLSDTIDDLDVETKEILKKSIVEEYLSGVSRNLEYRELEMEMVESAFDNMIEITTPTFPYLFFTKVGYKYIPSKFHIADEKLREECFNYYKNLIFSFYLYHSEYGKEEKLWLIMIKILEYMFLLISQNDYVKLKRFMKIDNFNLYEANDCLVNCLLSFPQDMDLDLEIMAFENVIIPQCLNLFIADDTIFSKFTPYQVSNIIIGYFRQVRNKEKAMKNLMSKLYQIKEIFASEENEDQKRRRVYNSSWKL